jgi:hypothetical protein
MSGTPTAASSALSRGIPAAKGPIGVAVRDQSESPFAPILGSLVARVVGAEAAALVDPGGETVDYSGKGPPDEIRVAAAHWGIILRELQAQRSLATVSWFLIQTERAGFLIQALPEGYALVVRLEAEPPFSRFERALAVVSVALAHEAGWTVGENATASIWRAVDVTLDGSGRPAAVKLGGISQSVELLGRYAGGFEGAGALQERAWRVRVDFGAEAMLVREPSGFWYADEPLEELAGRGARPSKTPPRPPSHIAETKSLTVRRP